MTKKSINLPEEPLRFTSKQEVIEIGLEYLHGAGADHICKVCIPSGGSCCTGCSSLKYGVGCQKRNTSCTSWLCGFLKFIFYEAGLLQEWESFWDQVPGQDYRVDYTPPHFEVHQWLESPSIRHLSEAFAEDLRELIPANYEYWILELKETLDRHVNKIMDYDDPDTTRKIEKKLNYLTKDFPRFHSAKKVLFGVGGPPST